MVGTAATVETPDLMFLEEGKGKNKTTTKVRVVSQGADTHADEWQVVEAGDDGGGISEGVKKWVNKFSLTPLNNVSRTVMAVHTGGGIWDFALTASAEVMFSGGDDGLVMEVRRCIIGLVCNNGILYHIK